MTDLMRLTEDPDEQSELLMEHADVIDPDDPYHLEQAGRLQELARIKASLTPKRRKVAELLIQGLSTGEIVAKTGISTPTIAKTRKDPHVQRMIVLKATLEHHRRGPSMESRAAMLWRIALRNEDIKPRISISAVDVLNKQTGVYKPEDTNPHQPAQINVVNFNFNNSPTPLGDLNDPKHPHNQPNAHSNHDAIEGEFTPVTVDLDTPTDE